MDLEIKDEQTLSEIKAAFNEMFPLLKLEFFKKGHVQGQPNAKADMITDDPTIGEIRKSKNEGDLLIGGFITVGELERAFRDRYGLNVQVFRKSGMVWLETTTTDSLTLSEQNRIAEEKRKPVDAPKPGDIDYD